jgi:hypothetical protein
MSFLPNSDLLADLVVDDVPVDVRASMSEEQIKAVRSAARRRHAVDVRFTIPLLFTQIYFVMLVGTDTRRETVAVNRERRSRAGFHLSTVAIAVLSTAAVLVAATLLYVLKSRSGVNLFSGHVRDFVPFVK